MRQAGRGFETFDPQSRGYGMAGQQGVDSGSRWALARSAGQGEHRTPRGTTRGCGEVGEGSERRLGQRVREGWVRGGIGSSRTWRSGSFIIRERPCTLNSDCGLLYLSTSRSGDYAFCIECRQTPVEAEQTSGEPQARLKTPALC